MNKRVKFREEPLPESSTMVLIEAHKVQSVDDWTDVILSVLQVRVGFALSLLLNAGGLRTRTRRQGDGSDAMY